MVLNKDFKEFIALLNDHALRYLVIGGYAVNLHGYPRYTKDIDFWIEPTPNNIEKLLSVINDFGFASLGLDQEDFLEADNIIQLGVAPNRIDLLTHVEGIVFADCFDQMEEIEIDGISINFLNIQDLITAKKTSARLQDLADAEQLEKLKKEKNSGQV